MSNIPRQISLGGEELRGRYKLICAAIFREINHNSNGGNIDEVLSELDLREITATSWPPRPFVAFLLEALILLKSGNSESNEKIYQLLKVKFEEQLGYLRDREKLQARSREQYFNYYIFIHALFAELCKKLKRENYFEEHCDEILKLCREFALGEKYNGFENELIIVNTMCANTPNVFNYVFDKILESEKNARQIALKMAIKHREQIYKFNCGDPDPLPSCIKKILHEEKIDTYDEDFLLMATDDGDIFKYLLEKDPDPKITSKISRVSRHDRDGLKKSRLWRGDTTNDSWQIIHAAAHAKNPELLPMLLEKYPDLDPNTKTARGHTPLILAALHSNWENVRLLLKLPTIRINDTWRIGAKTATVMSTVMCYAEEEQKNDIVLILKTMNYLNNRTEDEREYRIWPFFSCFISRMGHSRKAKIETANLLLQVLRKETHVAELDQFVNNTLNNGRLGDIYREAVRLKKVNDAPAATITWDPLERKKLYSRPL